MIHYSPQVYIIGLELNIKFNSSKTVVMNFSPTSVDNNRISIKFGINTHLPVQKHKHLGLVLSNDLKWSSHIDYIVSDCCKLLGLLRRQSYNLSFEQKCTIYLSIIRPKIEYGSILYDSCVTSDAVKLEQLQRKAALTCTDTMYHTESKLMLIFLRWELLSACRTVVDRSLFYKILQCNIILHHYICII